MCLQFSPQTMFFVAGWLFPPLCHVNATPVTAWKGDGWILPNPVKLKLPWWTSLSSSFHQRHSAHKARWLTNLYSLTVLSYETLFISDISAQNGCKSWRTKWGESHSSAGVNVIQNITSLDNNRWSIIMTQTQKVILRRPWQRILEEMKKVMPTILKGWRTTRATPRWYSQSI